MTWDEPGEDGPNYKLSDMWAKKARKTEERHRMYLEGHLTVVEKF